MGGKEDLHTHEVRQHGDMVGVCYPPSNSLLELLLVELLVSVRVGAGTGAYEQSFFNYF